MAKHPQLDDPKLTIERSETIKKKRGLAYAYKNFYQIFNNSSKDLPKGKRVEIGSGGGFLKEIIPNIITSDIMKLPGCDLQFSAEKIPFPNHSISGFYLLNVFHHLKNPQKALQEMERCLKKGGKVIMIEPYNSVWGRFIYKNFHHEGFDPNAGWKIKKGGPLSGANGALPWIIFFRDRKIFEKRFPQLKIEQLRSHTPFLYLLSGGFSKPQLIPNPFFPIIKLIEKIIAPLNNFLGMFIAVILTKT